MYEKALYLYLYISPYSAHPTGMLTGLIIGNILQIHHLCSKWDQRLSYYNKFYHRLCARGYLPSQPDKLFTKGFVLTKTKPMPSTKNKKLEHERRNNTLSLTRHEPKDTTILHVTFHPKDPSYTMIQQSFINKFLGSQTSVAGFKRLNIAYSRLRNLGEILSYKKNMTSKALSLVILSD